MGVHAYFVIGGYAAILIAVIYMISNERRIGSSNLATALASALAAFTIGVIYYDGVLPVWINHATNSWGVQVWFDLLLAIGVALFFILPRARKNGMNIPLWVVFVLASGSIGLLAMVARLFWLEQHAQADSKAD